MNTCLNCSKPHSNPKFCSRSCGVSYNNRKYPKRGKHSKHPCEVCEKPTKNSRFCSSVCHKQNQYEEYIERWKLGEEDGGTEHGVSAYVRRYLIETRGEKCQIDGWNRVHPITGWVPLEVHHIASHSDHSEGNLVLMCPCCHSLTSTYRGLNRGNGRQYR